MRYALEQLLRWIFVSSADFWREHSYCYWRLDWDIEKNAVKWDLETDDLRHWERWLSQHYFTERRIDWMEQHGCVGDFWRYRRVVWIEIEEAPTMHERLEARLSLREWLQQNAPERMDLLEMYD